MSGVFAAVAGGSVLAGAAVSYIGSQNAANAAQNAAMLQMVQAQSNRRDAMQLADATPQELGTLGQAYTASSQRLGQQQKLMDAIDPSLMEASKQILSLLKGNNGGPSTELYSAQRNQLIANLRDQYGPGGELTSAGQHALNQFDMQMKSGELGQLGSVFQIGNEAASGFNSSLDALTRVGAGYSNIQTRKVNASLSTGSEMLQTAGAPFVGDALRGQGLTSLGNNVMNTGATLGSAYMMRGNRSAGGMPAANPTADWNPSSSGYWNSNPYGG